MNKSGLPCDQSGFTLTELLISTLILFIASAAIFSVLAEIQHTAGYQAEIQSVLNNTQIAMQTVQRYIRQAGTVNSMMATVETIAIHCPDWTTSKTILVKGE